MKKHVNPYSIHDPANLFEVGENSSHPELKDAKRIWEFKGYTFRSAAKLQDFFKDQGLDSRKFWMLPSWENDGAHYIIRIKIIERCSPEERRHVRELAF